jgi:hypothetical protein
LESTSIQLPKKELLMNSLLEKKMSQVENKFKDKFFMKKLILNPSKMNGALKNTTNSKVNSKKENDVYKLESLRTIDLDVKINSHRDVNKNNITQSNNLEKFRKENNILQTETKANISRNAAIERPNSNHNTIDQKYLKEKASKKLVYHHSTLSMPKLNSINMNNLLNNKVQPKTEIMTKDLKIEAEKQGIKIVENGKSSTRNFKQKLTGDFVQKSSGLENKNIYSSKTISSAHIQSNFNFNSTQNHFPSRNNIQMQTISPDLLSRQTLDNSCINKLINKENPNDKNIKILKNNYYNNVKVMLLVI